MGYEQEQRDELDALSEIYFNEIKVISDKSPLSFSIKVKPQISQDEAMNAIQGDENLDDDDDDDSVDEEDDEAICDQVSSKSPCVDLKFELPSKYPDEKPSIQILYSDCLQENDLIKLMDHLSLKSDELLGTVMVFSLVSEVIEWMITRSEKEATDIKLEREREKAEKDAEDQKKFEGTQVTEKNFLAWKAKFDAEMLKKKLDAQKAQQAEQGLTKGLTGREMFEKDISLAESDLNFVEDLDQHQIEALLHEIDEVDINDSDEDFEIGSDEEYDGSSDVEDLEDENM